MKVVINREKRKVVFKGKGTMTFEQFFSFVRKTSLKIARTHRA